MAEVKRGLSMLSPEARSQALKVIIAFFQDERDEVIGVIAAEALLDLFLDEIAPEAYNQAIDDAKKSWREQVEGGEIAFELLKKKI